VSLFSISSDVIPSCKAQKAIDRGVEKNILFIVGGGLGDQICAEPTLRYALENFTGYISLYAPNPELFSHLRFQKVFKHEVDTPDIENYLTLNTYVPETHFQNEFLMSLTINAVDYASLCAFKSQLPVCYRTLKLNPDSNTKLKMKKALECNADGPHVIVHPGAGWPSKTFPPHWWDEVLYWLKKLRCTPIVIGEKTVDLKEKTADFRGLLSIQESIALLQYAHVVLTNDSAPLHMAASESPRWRGLGAAWIGFLATVKHPDYLLHWRHGRLGWRMRNLSLGGMWNFYNPCPNRPAPFNVKNVSSYEMESWLPEPRDVALWAVERWDVGVRIKQDRII
jgi:hypothetical protein